MSFFRLMILPAVLALALFQGQESRAQDYNPDRPGQTEGQNEGGSNDSLLLPSQLQRKPIVVRESLPPSCTTPGQTACLCPDGRLAGKSGCADKVAEPARTKPPRKARPIIPANSPRVPAGFAPATIACIDPDLYAMLGDAYGWKPGLRGCGGACLPHPAGSMIPSDKLDARLKAANLNWCADDCIRLSGYLPAEEIIAIEQQTGRKFCAAPSALACQAGDTALPPPDKALARVASLFASRKTISAQGQQALLIGISDYRSPMPGNGRARNDLEAMRSALADQMGYGSAGVHVARDTTATGLRAFLGKDGPLAKLPPHADVTVYVSALGFTDPASGKAYLLPSDSDPATPMAKALPMQEVYDALAAAGADTVTLWLEASFPTSVGALIDPPNLPAIESAVMPSRPIAGLTVLTAADRDQFGLTDPELGTGLFTRYLVEGLSGEADAAPIGNGDRKIDSIELYVFTAHKVRVTARTSFGLEQKPQLSEARNALVRAF